MENLKYKKSSVSISGDYYQIMFHEDLDDENEPYFLVQYDFEFPGKEYYIESDNENFIGHYIVNSVVIENRTFIMKYGTNDKFIVSIEYNATDEEQAELIDASKKMFAKVMTK
jgi:hypothetical protein